MGAPGSVSWTSMGWDRVPDPPTTSCQAPVGVRTSSSLPRGVCCPPCLSTSSSPTSFPALTPRGLRPQRWPPLDPEEREPLTCDGRPIGGPVLQDQRPLGAEREVSPGRGFRGAGMGTDMGNRTHGDPYPRTDARLPSPWTVRLKLQLSNLSLVDTSQR